MNKKKRYYNLPYEWKEADLKNREYQRRPVPRTEPIMQLIERPVPRTEPKMQ